MLALFWGASNDEGNCNIPYAGEGQYNPPLRASRGSDEKIRNTNAETENDILSKPSDQSCSCVY